MIQSNDANSISRFVNDQFCSVIYMDYDDYNPDVRYVLRFLIPNFYAWLGITE